MVFSNLTFVCLFLPITLALYFSSPKWLHNAVLVAASIVFYIWGGRIAIVLVLVSIAVNFHLGQAIAASDAERRDRLIRCSVAGNLFVLIVFKYLDFVVDNLNVVLDATWHWKIPQPAHPAADRHLVLHLPCHLVSGRRLSRRRSAAAISGSVRALHHQFSAAHRRTDRALPADFKSVDGAHHHGH